jgi:hypothetical protein
VIKDACLVEDLGVFGRKAHVEILDAGGSYLVGHVQAIALPDEGFHGQSGPAGNGFLD